MTQVVEPHVRHDPGRIACLPPEPVEFVLGQRPVSTVAGKYSLPGSRIGEAIQQLPRRLAQQKVPRSDLRVNQDESVRLDLAPAQAAYLTRPASGEQDQPHRRDAERTFGFEAAQGRPELRQIVRSEKPPTRRAAVVDDAGARVSRRPRADGPTRWRSRTCCAVSHGQRFAPPGFRRPYSWKKGATSARTTAPTRRWPRAGRIALLR